MDPIAASTTFATIVSLAADFISQRRAGHDASLEEFKAWLADKRHGDIIKLLESNTATTVGMKALLHESHSAIVGRLGQLERQIASRPNSADRSLAQGGAADVVETICLGVNNAFVGTAADLTDLATRCAIHAIEGKRVEFQIALQETALDVPPDDPLILPKYEKARLERAHHLTSRLGLLTSQSVHEWWQYFLSRKEDWELAIQALLLRAAFEFNGNFSGLKKIDVWRTDEPRLNAPIYLNAQEVDDLLRHLGFQSMKDLRFGSHWRAAIDLPLDLIARHVIPSIIVQIEQQEAPVVGDTLNLAAWHIGEG